jgi:glycosyltransferase involved in cell wall biosynthesis
MALAKILIVSNGPLCRNPRVVKEAATLGGAGYDVTVLIVRNHAPSEPADLDLLRGAPYRRETVELLPSGGAGSFFRRFELRIAREAAARLGWPTPRALGPFGPLLRRARALPADLTIVHNEVAHCVGLRLLDENRRVAADIEDWHSEDLLPQERARRPLSLMRATERALLHRTAHTTTTSHALADALHARYGGARPEVIANAFPLQPAPVRDTPREVPAFFWFSQTLGPARGLEQFLAAWARTRHESRVVLLGEARADYAAQLRALVPESHRTRVEFLPLVPPADLPALIACHDIGLALEQSFIVNRDLTVTNKILQYLNAGLAVVASDTAGQREVLAHNPDAGLIVKTDDTAAFAAALDVLVADRGQRAARQRAARRLAETTYCWEREAPRLLATVASSLEKYTRSV